MGPRLTAEAYLLLQRQRGVVACWQGRGVGIDPRSLRRAADLSDEWHWVGQGTVAFGRLPLSMDQRRVVACLDVGPHGVLGGIAALQEAGWGHGSDGKVDVIVPRKDRASRRKLPSYVRLHFTQWEICLVDPVRRTQCPRSVVDAAAWARSDREAMFVATSAMQQGLLTPSSLKTELGRRRSGKRSDVLRDVVAEFLGGSQSMGELDFVRECRKRGLPEPTRQVQRLDATGRRRFTDAEFRRSDGRVVMVEVDGVGHMSVASWQADMERHNDLVLASEAVVLRVTTMQLRSNPDPFFAKLRRALESSEERKRS